MPPRKSTRRRPRSSASNSKCPLVPGADGQDEEDSARRSPGQVQHLSRHRQSRWSRARAGRGNQRPARWIPLVVALRSERSQVVTGNQEAAWSRRRRTRIARRTTSRRSPKSPKSGATTLRGIWRQPRTREVRPHPRGGIRRGNERAKRAGAAMAFTKSLEPADRIETNSHATRGGLIDAGSKPNVGSYAIFRPRLAVGGHGS